LNSPSPSFSSPISGIVLTGLIFPFSYMSMKLTSHSSSIPFPYILPPPLVPIPRQELFYLPVLHFLKRHYFCLR
jgi:hypothetical protein